MFTNLFTNSDRVAWLRTNHNNTKKNIKKQKESKKEGKRQGKMLETGKMSVSMENCYFSPQR